ncbi:hypothetical protein AHAS_Ahas05G0193300 [Arachis hypogaea]
MERGRRAEVVPPRVGGGRLSSRRRIEWRERRNDAGQRDSASLCGSDESWGAEAFEGKRRGEKRRGKIESALPTLARPIMSLDQNEDAIVGSLKQSLRQVETLGAQRAGLEDMLKEMKRKDDILPKNSSNIEAQEQLLMQIQAQNDEFSALFNLEDYKASREKCYKQIEAAIAKFREIKNNINEGLKFYVTLQDAITNVKQ